jgi:CO/xanthine dehydrogenase Mo-binding subunit
VSDADLSPSLLRNPELDTWIRIHADGTVTLRTGKVEIGQGIKTALAMIGAEELDVSIDRIRVRTADTASSPNELYTAGSTSIEESGEAVRRAAADARSHLLERAAETLGVHVDRLEVSDGTVRCRETGSQVTYWELWGDRDFGCAVTGRGAPKHPESYALVGTTAPRLDLPDKVTGAPCFVHDLERPGMVHGRVVRPPSYGAQLVALDHSEVRGMPGVLEVVRDGRFIGVLAEREEQAVKAVRRLASLAEWSETPELPRMEEIHARLQGGASQSFRVVDGIPQEGEVEPFRPPEGRLVEATYRRPFQMHASLGPSAALAELSEGSLTVWTHSQGASVLRLSLAQALGMEAERVRVIHAEGAGCYGHNGADDAALDAALLAHALPERPVLLQWMREDENAWEPYGSAMVVKLQAALDAGGRITAWSHDVWSYTHMGRPLPYGERSGLLAAWHREPAMQPPRARPSLGEHAGIHRNADPIYDLPERRIVKHFVDDAPLRVSSTRSLGAYANVFAIESFMDELAHASGCDPVELRLRHLGDARGRAVIEAAAERAKWGSGALAEGRGRGIGFARYKNRKCYAAVVVELEVDSDTAEIRLERAVIAADAGQVVDADGLANQLEGGLIQSASWTLKEQVCFDELRVVSVDWQSYPILTFPEVPEVETLLLNRPGSPSLGSGEAAQGPTAAAIANAVFDAVGLRLREIPFTPERLRAAASESS